MKLKKSIVAIILTLFILPAWAQKKVALSGKIDGLAGREVSIFGNGNFDTPITRTNGDGDTFKMTIDAPLDESSSYYVLVPAIGSFGPSMKMPYFMLFLDAPTLMVDATIKDDRLSLTTIKGSKMMDDFIQMEEENKVNAQIEEAGKEYQEIFDTYNVKKEQSEENKKRLTDAGKALDVLYGQKAEYFGEMIATYPKSKALAIYIKEYSAGETIEKRKELISKFDPSIRTSGALASMAAAIQLEEKSATGNLLPDFNTYTVDGKLDKLSNYKGQYLLIDFWASWCGPCIKEIPNLKSVYADYKDKGLKLVGISVDSDMDKWKKAIQELNLTNLQVHDTDNVTGKLLNYQGIPFIILVSPEGVILERNIRGEDIRKKVQQYLD